MTKKSRPIGSIENAAPCQFVKQPAQLLVEVSHAIVVGVACQSSEDRHEGWRYFLEQTEIKPGTDLAVATSMRQKELELRESQAALDEPVHTSFRH